MTRRFRNRAWTLALPGLVLVGHHPAAAVTHGRPSLKTIEDVLLTTARQDFNGQDAAFETAAAWHERRLAALPERGTPHLACAEYRMGRHARLKLENLFSRHHWQHEAGLRRVSNHKELGTCFIVTASASQSGALSADLRAYGLESFSPIPSVLKLAPGLLDHEGSPQTEENKERRLSTRHGKRMKFNNVGGLDVALSPGVLEGRGSDGTLTDEWMKGLMSKEIDLHASNFWSDPGVLNEGDDHMQHPWGALLAREWSRAADVVHELSAAAETAPGDICGWDNLIFHEPRSDFVVISGMDHLLHLGRGTGGREGEESEELKVACLMGLVSYLASIPEVRRIAPLHVPELKNAVAAAIAQSGNIQDKPLTDAGLDGTGEVIQIVDSGLDETSCFFIDDDGEEVEHGYFFDELTFIGEAVPSNAYPIFAGGYFPSDATRRKIVQYIRLVKPDDGSQNYGSGIYTTMYYRFFPWYSASGFGEDMEEGHGTHTAGSAAGSTLNTPADTGNCVEGGSLSCVGGCLSAFEAVSLPTDGNLDFETLCPEYDCDGRDGFCLEDDVAQTLTDNGGIARGAKISVFDGSMDGVYVWAWLAGTDMWESTEGTGCKLHSNSWGGDGDCNVDSESMAHDNYMFQNQDHLLIFAAGNEGDPEDEDRTTCTINSPGIAKNVLAVGASSSGTTRWPTTADDGEATSAIGDDVGDIDTVAYFSSYGLTKDGRIKPEVVAPGDQVLSAASDGTDSHSCKLTPLSGTSMATPIVAGAAAMVRQYFTDQSFYASDVEERGFCQNFTDVNSTNAFVCEEFPPSAATVKAMLINSADLMGGSSEPDGFRGFGRVHLEPGMPLGGEGDRGLFVVDSLSVGMEEYTIVEYSFDLIPNTGLELRATLAWIDPAAEVDASIQLQNDLDLTVVAPDGTLYRMWSDGADDRNVVERVVVDSTVLEASSGSWTVAVSCFGLTTDQQPYSLVVTGPIAQGSGGVSSREASGAAGTRGPGIAARVITAATTILAAVVVVGALPV